MDRARKMNAQWISVIWYFGLLDMNRTTWPGIEQKIFKKWKNNIIILQENNYNSEVNCSKILVLVYKEKKSYRTREQKMPSFCQTDVIYVNQEWEPTYNLTNMLISKTWIFKVLYWVDICFPLHFRNSKKIDALLWVLTSKEQRKMPPCLMVMLDFFRCNRNFLKI